MELGAKVTWSFGTGVQGEYGGRELLRRDARGARKLGLREWRWGTGVQGAPGLECT